MAHIRGIKWKDIDGAAQITVPASSASVQEIKQILDGDHRLSSYSIRLRADVYKVKIEGRNVEQVRGFLRAPHQSR
ncbi:hypothetical protein SCUP515_08483 [Seiridium cupressi]